MGFTSCTGRLLFASFFLFSAWQQFYEFGVDGGLAAQVFRPKLDLITGQVNSLLGVQLPEVDIKYVVGTAIALKGIGGILFVFGCSVGAYVLLLYLAIATPLFYDCYNYNMGTPEFRQLLMKSVEEMALIGALLFFLGMKNSIPKRQPKTNNGNKKKASKSKTH